MIAGTEAEYQPHAGSTKETPYLTLKGEIWGVFCEYFWENLPYIVLSVWCDGCVGSLQLQVLVRYRRLELVLHPVVLKLIHMKWKKFGRWASWLLLDASQITAWAPL